MALALRVEYHIVVALFDRVLLVIACVKVRRLERKCILFDPIDVVVEQVQLFVTLIEHFNPYGLAKGHAPEAIVRVTVFHHDRDADDFRTLSETVGKEVAQRHLDGRFLLAVIEDSQQNLLVVCRTSRGPRLPFGTEKREPHMSHHSGALCIKHHFGGSRSDSRVIRIARDIVAVLVRGS